MKHILVTLDGSELAERGLPHAAMLARLFGARLTLARVPEAMMVPVASAGTWVAQELAPEDASEHVARYLAEVSARPELAGLAVDIQMPPPPVVSGLVAAVAHTDVDLVVLTTHGHSGITRMLLGSVASKLVEHAPAPVYVVPADRAADAVPEPATIVVPLDGSANGEAALPSATELARRVSATLRLVRVPTVPAYLTVIPDTAAMIPGQLQHRALEAERYLAETAEPLSAAGLDVAADVEMALERGVEQAIITYAGEHDADLIVLASHGHSGIARMIMGSVADRVLRLADCPVWVVRVDGGR